MGKYMKKSKLTGDIAVMGVSPHSSPALRTRAAKTLALQRLNKSFSQSPFSSSPRPVSSSSPSSSSYLQLRSRRLEKPPMILRHHQKPQQDGGVSLECSSTDSRLNRDFANSASVDSEKRKLRVETEGGNVRDFEDCFGENRLEFGGTAGKIPSSLVRNSSTNETSHSTRMETNSLATNSRVEMELLKSIPTANDIEEFFAHEELWHQRTFIQKYNFDFGSEMPLQGRYEWLQVVP